ncbi:MAG: ABC transporter ATP-binding protein, partial [Anaerolineales bacterium]
MTKPLLEVTDLVTEFRLARGVVHAVNSVSFELAEGQVLGLVGESGSGKSVTALSILRLIEAPGRIAGGKVLFYEDDQTSVDLMELKPSELEDVRGNKISMIFQDPMTSLNPVLSVGYQLTEPLKQHRHMGEAAAKDAAVKLLARVGIPQPALRMKDYPHQFSGGMRQRVMIAMALAC